MDRLQEERDILWRREHRDEQLAPRRVIQWSRKDFQKQRMVISKQNILDRQREAMLEEKRKR